MTLESNNTTRRLIIYFLFDQDGIVDRYIPNMLKDLRKSCTELCVVSNGDLEEKSRTVLESLTDKLVIRDNIGFDVWAYKEAMASYGWDRLNHYDEIVLMNYTIMGPVYSLSEMFEDMNAKDLDFWGLTKFHGVKTDPYHTKYGYLPEHIQSHFIAVRKSMFSSPEFRYYWDTMPPILDYEDAVGKHEAIFTKHFSDMGYRWACFVDTADMEGYSWYPLMFSPTKLIRDYRCPVFKRRSFFDPVSDYYSFLDQSPAVELMEYLEQHTSFDTNMIWENLLRTNHLTDIKNTLNLNYIVPASVPDTDVSMQKTGKAALIIEIGNEKSITTLFLYAESMPVDSDIYLVATGLVDVKPVRSQFENGQWNSVHVISGKKNNQSPWIIPAETLEQYEAVCFVHDQKSVSGEWELWEESKLDYCFSNLLPGTASVENIIRLFRQNPRLGLLIPPPSLSGKSYELLGREWSSHYSAVKAKFDELRLRCPITPNKEPVWPMENMFWFRPDAFNTILQDDNKNWQLKAGIEDKDSASSYLYPYIAQSAGYYTAWIVSEANAKEEWTKHSFMLREMDKRLFTSFGTKDFNGLINTMDAYIPHPNAHGNPLSAAFALKHRIKRHCPAFVWKIAKKSYHLFGGTKWNE